MGNSPSLPQSPSSVSASAVLEKEAMSQDLPVAGVGCPVKSGAAKKAMHGGKSAPEAGVKEGCSVKHTEGSGASSGRSKVVYNVYGEEIDPTNMMPYNPNQEPRPEQKYPLSTDRVQSTIPKGGVDSTWQYPSEQMFFNALRRKGKGDDVHEGDVSTIIAIHNNMNERTWNQVLQYEQTLYPGSSPKLLKFMGRPDELSPIARAKTIFGGAAPFDRHDWFVERDNGSTVRYVIDYYYDEGKSKMDVVPDLHSEDKVKSISMFARPAIDSIDALVDRVKYPLKTFFSNDSFSRLSDMAKTASRGEAKSSVESMSIETVNKMFADIKESCQDRMIGLRMCEGEAQCTKAATALQYCMGKIVCKPEAEKFNAALLKGNDQLMETTFNAMNDKIKLFEESATKAMREQAIVAARTNNNSPSSS